MAIASYRLPGLIHVVENPRETKFRNLLVELLPGFDDLRRGPVPTNALGDAKVRPGFNDERVSVFLIELASGSQVGSFGPAIVASPYENEVELAAPQGTTRTLKQFTDLAWIEPGAAATLRSYDKHPAKAVFIALGRR